MQNYNGLQRISFFSRQRVQLCIADDRLSVAGMTSLSRSRLPLVTPTTSEVTDSQCRPTVWFQEN